MYADCLSAIYSGSLKRQRPLVERVTFRGSPRRSHHRGRTASCAAQYVTAYLGPAHKSDLSRLLRCTVRFRDGSFTAFLSGARASALPQFPESDGRPDEGRLPRCANPEICDCCGRALSACTSVSLSKHMLSINQRQVWFRLVGKKHIAGRGIQKYAMWASRRPGSATSLIRASPCDLSRPNRCACGRFQPGSTSRRMTIRPSWSRLNYLPLMSTFVPIAAAGRDQQDVKGR